MRLNATRTEVRVRRFLEVGVTALILLGVTGCATKDLKPATGPAVRAAVDVPDHFLVATPKGPAEPTADGSCRNPLLDPRDETRLSLIRSAGGRGDYQPNPLRYGVTADELLRVDCGTGRAVGIVKR